MPTHNQDICINPPFLTKVQGTIQKRAGKNAESSDKGGVLWTLSSGHDVASALLNAQQLWLPASGVDKFQAPPLMKELL